MDEFAEVGVKITHGYSKRTEIPAGVHLRQHAHKYDHISVLAQGTAEVKIEGSAPVVYHAPAEILVKATYVHSVNALTPVVWYCIHDMSDLEAEVRDQLLIV